MDAICLVFLLSPNSSFLSAGVGYKSGVAFRWKHRLDLGFHTECNRNAVATTKTTILGLDELAIQPEADLIIVQLLLRAEYGRLQHQRGTIDIPVTWSFSTVKAHVFLQTFVTSKRIVNRSHVDSQILFMMMHEPCWAAEFV